MAPVRCDEFIIPNGTDVMDAFRLRHHPVAKMSRLGREDGDRTVSFSIPPHGFSVIGIESWV